MEEKSLIENHILSADPFSSKNNHDYLKKQEEEKILHKVKFSQQEEESKDSVSKN